MVWPASDLCARFTHLTESGVLELDRDVNRERDRDRPDSRIARPVPHIKGMDILPAPAHLVCGDRNANPTAKHFVEFFPITPATLGFPTAAVVVPRRRSCSGTRILGANILFLQRTVASEAPAISASLSNISHWVKRITSLGEVQPATPVIGDSLKPEGSGNVQQPSE